jgi:mono/diheme cytochrome c family protein
MSRRILLALCCVLALNVGCGEDDDGDGDDARVQDVLALTGDANAAQSNYAAQCTVCHAEDGSGTPSGDDIRSISISDEEIVEVILYGKGTMSAYGSIFSDQEIADLAALVQTL